jgi:hypothetical protein
MLSWLIGAPQRKSQQPNKRPAVRPRLESLEDRLVPALTNHGGGVLASVEAQSIYLGSGWSTSPIAPSQLDNFLSTTVDGTTSAPAPYIAMLANAGFAGVTGAGSSTPGVTDSVSVDTTITDAQIQSELASDIQSTPGVQQPDANTLYFVFVQPGTVVDLGNGETSVNTFLAYHSSFALNGSLVRYAVVPFHGTGGNAQDPWLNSAQDSMTVAASHEMAEAITDPDGQTYFDRSGNEVGDIVNGSTVYLNGYAVQRESAIQGSESNFLAMTPAGSTGSHAAIFSIAGGALQVTEADGTSFVAANPSGETGTAVSVSTQGIDDFGQPMVDVLFSDGRAFEYHDFATPTPTSTGNPGFFPWTALGSNVQQAVAGQGVSYVLFTNGSLGEFVDPNYATFYYGYGVNPGSRGGVIASSVTGIVAAGTDQLAVNAVEYTVRGSSTVREWRDVTARSSTSTTGFQPNPQEVVTDVNLSAPQVAAQPGIVPVAPTSIVGGPVAPMGTGVSTSLPVAASSLGVVASSLGTTAPAGSSLVVQSTTGPAVVASPAPAVSVQVLASRLDLGAGGGDDQDDDSTEDADPVPAWFGDPEV